MTLNQPVALYLAMHSIIYCGSLVTRMRFIHTIQAHIHRADTVIYTIIYPWPQSPLRAGPQWAARSYGGGSCP